MKFLLRISLGLILTSAGISRAADGDFKPVVLLQTNGQATGETTTKVVEELTGAVRESVLRIYGREIYGRGQGFRGKGSGSGPVGFVADTFTELDRNIQSLAVGSLAPELNKIPDGQNFRFEVEVIWVKNRERLGSISTDLPGVHSLALLWQMGGVLALSPDSPAGEAVDLVTELARTPLVNGNDVPGGAGALFDQGLDVYKFFREKARDKIVPLHLGFTLTLVTGVVSVDMRTTIKPTELSFPLDDPEPADIFLAPSLNWGPPQFVDDPPLARFIFRRTYGPKARANPPILQASFGRMYGTDVRNLAMCNTKCTEEDQAGQRHIKKSGPTIQGKLRTPTTFTGIKYTAMNTAVQAMNTNMDLFVLLNDLKFDITNPKDPKLLETQSRIPMIVRLIDPLNGRHHYDITQNQYGFDYMARFVNSKAAYKMNLTVKNKLKEADGNLNRQMKGIMAAVKEFFK